MYSDLGLQTFNIAICFYSNITLKPYKKGRVSINSYDIGQIQYSANRPKFDGVFGLVCALVNFFRVSGLEIEIKNDFPPFSGLGGSGSLSIALIEALSKALDMIGGNKPHNLRDVIWIAHTIEDSLFRNTGLQDQSAAAYGGINILSWRYAKIDTIFSHVPILITNNLKRVLEKRICLFYTSKPHHQTRKGGQISRNFKKGSKGLKFVLNINQNTHEFITNFQNQNWDALPNLLRVYPS